MTLNITDPSFLLMRPQVRQNDLKVIWVTIWDHDFFRKENLYMKKETATILQQIFSPNFSEPICDIVNGNESDVDNIDHELQV